jgi:hypothetical protein
MKKIILGAMILSFAACGEKSTTTETKTENKTEVNSSESAIKNGIVITENGLKVSKAMLLHEDGTEISNDNTVGIGEVILCRIFVSGWKDENGQVKIGAGQTVETNDGTVVLDQEDLFSTLESASLEDAGVITLKATITELNKSIHDFTVHFKVWDKTTNADVTGSYNFKLK